MLPAALEVGLSRAAQARRAWAAAVAAPRLAVRPFAVGKRATARPQILSSECLRAKMSVHVVRTTLVLFSFLFVCLFVRMVAHCEGTLECFAWAKMLQALTPTS